MENPGHETKQKLLLWDLRGTRSQDATYSPAEKGVKNGSPQIMLFMFPLCPNQQTQLEEARNLDAWELEVQDRNQGKPGCWRYSLVFRCLPRVHEVLGPASSMTTIQ